MYWYKIKSGDLRLQERPRKNGLSVLEIQEIIYPGSISIHYLDLIKNSVVIKKCDIITYCGYDRGPKMKNRIHNLLMED